MAEEVKRQKCTMENLNREIAEELMDLSRKLRKKATEFKLKGDFEKAIVYQYLAGYLKGAAELWKE